MGMRKRLVVPAWIGLLLIVSGFLAFTASYFLLPLYVTTYCGDDCTTQLHATTWEFSQTLLSHLRMALEINPLLLLLMYLSLLMAAVVVGCGLGFLLHRWRAFAIWSHRAWLMGIIALILLFPFTFGFSRPDFGYLGMLAGYALLWGGNRVFLATHHAARSDP